MRARRQIVDGDCFDVLRTLPARSVHTVVTSPPYYGLRDYGTPGQLGLEATPDEYVTALVAVFGEVRRVLRDDGTVWLNLGDSYAHTTADIKPHTGGGFARPGSRGTGVTVQRKALGNVKPKDLLGIPWMVAFALRADGWYLRSDIIWSKPNPMPESVTDRPTKAHEYVFLLSKSARYYYDADAVREGWADERNGASGGRSAGYDDAGTLRNDGGYTRPPTVAGRNKRSVWTVATQPYAGAHFATFPPKLIEPCVLAGSPERACGECGAPWVRVVERTAMVVRPTARREAWQAEDDHARTQTGGTMLEAPTSRTVGYEPSCAHGDGSARGVVLDPFCGAATTGLVAAQHGRDFIGIELSPEYAALGRARLEMFVRLGYRAITTPQIDVVSAGQGVLFEPSADRPA